MRVLATNPLIPSHIVKLVRTKQLAAVFPPSSASQSHAGVELDKIFIVNKRSKVQVGARAGAGAREGAATHAVTLENYQAVLEQIELYFPDRNAARMPTQKNC